MILVTHAHNLKQIQIFVIQSQITKILCHENLELYGNLPACGIGVWLTHWHTTVTMVYIYRDESLVCVYEGLNCLSLVSVFFNGMEGFQSL